MKQITITVTEQNGRLLAQLLQQIPLSGSATALAPAVRLVEDVCGQVADGLETAPSAGSGQSTSAGSGQAASAGLIEKESDE